ncbi:anti-sigma factor family protein [Granulicella aggregans]|nr:anti-sigma factor [Granulicella aggregans]
MNPPNQFGSAKPARGGEGTTCAQCEAMLPDWMDHAEDGEMAPKDRAAFELHIATCPDCSQMLADAQRGAALLQMLRSPRPEPSSALMDRILANTSGLAGPAKSRVSGVIAMPSLDGAEVEIQSVNPASYILTPATAQPTLALPAGNVLPFRSPSAARFSLRAITHTMMQPRLAMTAAMAFFSIALTLNLTGVRLSQLSVSDLKPSNLRRTFYQADASVVRYYDNLRVVYELESRVQDMKRSNDNSETDDAASGAKASPDSGETKDKSKSDQQRKNAPKAGSGTSQRHNYMQQNFRLAASQDQSHPPRRDSLEPALLTSFLERNTLATSNQSKKEEQEGVLA